MIALAKDKHVLNKLVQNLKNKNYLLTDERSLTKCFGVDIKYKRNGYFEVVQSGFGGEATHNTKSIYKVKPLLHKDLRGDVRKNRWNYRQAIGILTYFQGTSRADITMEVHQCTGFSVKPMSSHERAVK